MPNKPNNSREADKYLIRFSHSMRTAVDLQAERFGRSRNAEINQALINWFNQESDIRLNHALLLSVRTQSEITEAFDEIPLLPEEKRREEYVMRMPEGIRLRISEKAAVDGVSMNTVVLAALAWWLQVHAEIHALLHSHRQLSPKSDAKE